VVEVDKGPVLILVICCLF